MKDSRRQFMKAATAASLAAPAASADTAVPRRRLGKTGLQVSLMGLGGARTGNMEDAKAAEAIIRRCFDLGVNYFDTAAAGAYGLSQSRYGDVLKGLRDKVIFATKTRHRTNTQAQLDLDQSLSNLGTDYIDLYQVHNVINQEDIDFIFAKGGVIEMIEKARKQGKIRFVGFTGHTEPAILNKMMSLYDFSTILLPLSVVDGANKQKSFEKETLPIAKQKNLGIIAMKTLGAGVMLKAKATTVEESLRYVWSLPVSTAILGCDQIAHVEGNLALAKTAKPMTAAEMQGLRDRMSRYTVAQLEPWKLGREDDPSGPVYRAD